MLSTSYYLQQQKKEKYDHNDKAFMESMFRVFLLLFIIDLIILVFAISCALKLELDPLYTVVLIVLMFVPGLGFLTQIGVIFYYYLSRHGHNAITSPAPPAYEPETTKFMFF